MKKFVKYIVIGSYMVAMPNPSVWAQQPLPPDTPVNLNVTISEADKIWKGLRKQPVEDVEELMNKIRQQVATQTQPKPTEDKKDVPTTPNTPN